MVKKEKRAVAKKEDKTKYVAGVIIAIIILVALILLIRSVTKPAPEEVVPTKPAEKPAEEKEIAPAEKPEEIRYCNEEFAIGWPKNTLGSPCKIEGDTARIILRYSGKGTSLPGMWFKLTDAAGTVSYFRAKGDMMQGDEKLFNVPLNGARSVLALPMKIENGKEKACLNQQLLVVKEQSCVRGG